MPQSVQVFGRKRNATAVAHCKAGRGVIKVNGVPIDLMEPEPMRLKCFEPVLLHRRHSCPCQRRWSIRPNLRCQTSHLQILSCLLPKIHRRSHQKRNQRSLVVLRQNTVSCRSKKMRTQKIRGTFRSCSLPKILPLDGIVYHLMVAVFGWMPTCNNI
jgi:hypothetical protein